MRQPDDIRLRHMREAAEKAVRFCAERSRNDLKLLRLALTKLVEIVGEAAKLIPEETRRQHPDVPWAAAARMRDRLIHHYFDIDLDILWSTVTSDLPALLRSLPPQ